MKAFLWIAVSFLSFSSVSPAALASRYKPVAYVYDDQGACAEGCAKAASLMASEAGFYPIYIGAQDLNEKSTPDQVKHFFDGVKIWIQPGGESRDAYAAINPVLRKALTDFIFSGGGYVGFCAGAFITTAQVGNTGTPGFNIFPGITAPYDAPPARPDLDYSIEEVTWAGKSRAIYFEGGPYLDQLPPSVEVIATYNATGKVAAARTTYGLGRVFISGPHPEAPKWWAAYGHIPDRDGSDADLAVSMIQWAANPAN